LLGYDLLFQDLDVVWYRNPMELLQNKNSPLYNYDVIIQDDGNPLPIYLPYRGCAGFYFVRSNKKTKNWLMSYIFSLDRIRDKHNDQGLFNTVLAHHRSMTGMRVKVLNPDIFPSGRDFQIRKQYMADMASGKIKPVIFHMNWTAGLHEKFPFMKQMGMWYVKDDVCHGENGSHVFDEVGADGFADKCCSSKALVSCHFRNKPSVIPCDDSPLFS
jgi:hypothetical protein